MEYRRFGALSSSSNPNQLADTICGAILGSATFIIYIAAKLGFNIGVPEVTQFAVVFGGAGASLWTLYGLVKKIVIALQRRMSAPAPVANIGSNVEPK